jgi:hypothetical protein
VRANRSEEQWLKEDVHIRGARGLELHHLYRAMDFLEANKEEIEQAIYFQVSDLLNLDVDIVFYDTTSLHFEIDEEDEGDGEGEIKGSFEAGNKSYPAPRKRGHSKTWLPCSRQHRQPVDRAAQTTPHKRKNNQPWERICSSFCLPERWTPTRPP